GGPTGWLPLASKLSNSKKPLRRRQPRRVPVNPKAAHGSRRRAGQQQALGCGCRRLLSETVRQPSAAGRPGRQVYKKGHPMTADQHNPVPTGFDALPVLDLRAPNFTVEGNRILAELRAKGPACRVEPFGALGFLRWAECDSILRDFKTFSAAFPLSAPVPGAGEEMNIDTLLREDPPKHTRVRALMQQG